MAKDMHGMEIGMDSIHINIPECEMYINTHQMYTMIRRLYAEENIRGYLADEDYTEEQIESLVTVDLVDRWLNAVSNNATIAECKQLAAAELAEEMMQQ